MEDSWWRTQSSKS